MFENLGTTTPAPVFLPSADTGPCPLLDALTKKMHFFRFLQKEMGTARTEAEKEAVFSILMKTKVQILALKRQWAREQAMEKADLNAPPPCTAHRIQ
jgi:hypothetical protein